MSEALITLHGRKLGIGHDDQLVSHGVDISSQAVDATITVGDEATNVVTITAQLTKADGSDVDAVCFFEIVLATAGDGTALGAPSPSTGLAVGTDGAIRALVAHQHYLATCEADGDIDLTWTDTGAGTTYIGFRLPSGRVVWGDQAITTT